MDLSAAPSRRQATHGSRNRATGGAFGSSAEWQTTRHLPTDTPLFINPAGLREVVDLVTEIVCTIADRTLEWSRPQPEA
jgi:hypothetical protein